MTWGGSLVRAVVRSRAARSVVAVIGVAASTLLVLVLLAGYRGVEAGVRAYAGQPAIDLWVAPRGTDNMIRSSALLPISTIAGVASADGIADASPILRSFVAVEAGEARINLLAVGYPGPDGMGGPPVIVDGRRPHGPDEVSLDRAAAYRLGVGLDDIVTIGGGPFQVVGLTSGTNLIATSFVFLDSSAIERASGVSGYVSFVVVRLDAGASPEAVAADIETRHDHLSVYSRDAWVANNLLEVTRGFRPLQVLMVSIGVIAATVLVALLALGAVDDRRHDIAVLFALGAQTRVVGTAIVWQAVRLALIGVVGGAIATALLVRVLDRTLPTVELAGSWGDIAGVLAVFGAASILATLLPFWRLRRIDPAEAFRP
jgi:putative ABC transport system permease protein